MKLKWNWVYYPYLDAPNKQEESALKAGYIKVVSKDDADKEIAELKAKLDRAIAERDGNQVCIDALKQKLESVQASMYCDVVDANMENRRLRRALWIARAKRAIEKIAWFKLWNASISTMNPEDGTRQEFDKWKKSLGKFLNKAEKYK
jgi:hypothetical protein